MLPENPGTYLFNIISLIAVVSFNVEASNLIN